jgi:copper transport protein
MPQQPCERMRGIVFVSVLLAAIAQAGAALAHASLIRSEPADRAVVALPPSVLTLIFNEPVSPLVFRLVGPSGEATELKDVAADNATVTIRLLDRLGSGTHLLSWRVISADSHPVGGALTFSIGQPSARPATPHLDSDRGVLGAAVWIARLALYIGLLLGVGGTFYAEWIAAEPLSPRVGKIVAAALECGLVAAVISVGLQGVDALGLSLSDLKQPKVWTAGLATSYGFTATIAAGAMIVGLAALRSSPERGRRLSLLGLVGVGVALAASGHASAAEPQVLTRPAVFLHGVAVAFWIGALLPLAAAMRAPKRRQVELTRFSRAIPIAIVVLVASGTVLAVVQLRRFDALWTTDYGLVLSGKLAAVLVLLALAAVNRYALTSRVMDGDGIAAGRLARSIKTELLIALLVLGLVATWRFTPPPRALFAAAEAPVHVHIHSDKAMADVEIEPAHASTRRITVTVLDGQFGPLPAKEVTLFLGNTAAGIESLRLPATHVEGAAWLVDNVSIPTVGRWQVRVEILINDFEKVTIEDQIDLPR